VFSTFTSSKCFICHHGRSLGFYSRELWGLGLRRGLGAPTQYSSTLPIWGPGAFLQNLRNTTFKSIAFDAFLSAVSDNCQSATKSLNVLAVFWMYTVSQKTTLTLHTIT